MSFDRPVVVGAFLLSVVVVAAAAQGPKATVASQAPSHVPNQAPSTAPNAAPSGSRGVETVNEETAAVKNGHQYVVAIGIDHYENWPMLGTAVSDATGFAQLLTSKFGFENAV